MDQPIVLYEDDHLVVINKPPGWVAHEGAGETGETVADWLAKSYPQIMEHPWSDLTRVGIVHRLDKGTSGVMVLAKSPAVLKAFQSQFQNRQVKKTYTAIVFGQPKEREGEIKTYLGRHPRHRQTQAVLPIPLGQVRREAVTEYKVEKTGKIDGQPISLVTFWPHTGRMHQIRIQAKYLGTPILGDPVYTTKPAKHLAKALGLGRQLLHARELAFRHPATGGKLNFKASPPKEFTILEKGLAAGAAL